MSAFKKSLLVAGVAMILSNNVFADEGHGIVKFKGEVISAHVLLNQVTKI
ncbi:fimbrial-like adhesin protein [Escherichia coli]|nr:fimbrial-like adhesin protein [Escherichia coli]